MLKNAALCGVALQGEQASPRRIYTWKNHVAAVHFEHSGGLCVHNAGCEYAIRPVYGLESA